MTRLSIGLVAALLSLGPVASARAQAGLPSKEQVAALVDSADQTVDTFEDAVKAAKSWLDKLDPELVKEYLAAASDAHDTVREIQKTGGSAHALVSLQASLSELNLDAANGSLQLMAAYAGGVSVGMRPDPMILATIMGLSTAGDGCGDRADGVLEAALRFIEVEEDLVRKALAR